MGRRRFRPAYIVVRETTSCNEPENNTENYYSEKGKDSGYKAYVEKHGMHFTDALAEEAIKWLENTGPQKEHKWSVAQVSKAIMPMLNSTVQKHKVTMGDLAYLANMYYSDLYPAVINNETDCLKAAIVSATDPDGYEGQAFGRWIADIMGKGVEFDWYKYI